MTKKQGDFITFYVVVIFLSLQSTPCVAYENEKPDSIVSLPEFEILVNTEKEAAIAPTQKLRGEDLENLNSHNVADALRYFSGVQLKDYGGVGGIKTLDIRSMGSNHLGVFYDGIQLGNAQNGQIDLGKFSLDNVEEISLYNGQKSELLQSAKDFGSAGTVYLRTRRPVFRDSKRYNLNITFRTGSFGLVNPSARFEYKISEKISASANAEFIYANGRYKFRYKSVYPNGETAWDTTAVRRNGDIHSFRLEGGLFGKVDRGHWQWKLYYYNSEKGIPGAIVNNVWKNSQRQWDRNFFTQGSFLKIFGERLTMLVNAKYARDYMRYLNPDTTLMYIDNRFWQDETYLSLVNKVNILENWNASIALDWQWNYLNSDMINFSFPHRNMLLASIASSYQISGFRAQASLLSTFVWDKSKINRGGDFLGERSKRFDEFSPALFLNWQPWYSHGFYLKAFYKRVFRMPTFNDLYYTDMGNADLKPEYVTQYDLGASFVQEFTRTVWKSIEVSVDGYHNRIRDKIIAVPKGTGQYRWMMMNIGRVRITGMDFAATANAELFSQLRLRMRLSYTFQRALDYTDPSDNKDAAGTYRKQIAYIPRHSGSVAASAFYKRFTLNYSFIYVGARYQNSSNIPVNYVQPWYTHDASISYLQPIGKTGVKATLEVNNIFNQQYEVIVNYPMPGTNFKLILQFDI